MLKKIVVAMLLAFPLGAFSETASIAEPASATTDVKPDTLERPAGCLFHGVRVAFGGILNYADGRRKVCARGPGGPLMIDVSPGRTAID